MATHETQLMTNYLLCTTTQEEMTALVHYHVVNTIMRMHEFSADCTYGFQRRECWISAMEWFQRKPHKFLPDAPEGKYDDLTDTCTDQTITVTLLRMHAEG